MESAGEAGEGARSTQDAQDNRSSIHVKSRAASMDSQP